MDSSLQEPPVSPRLFAFEHPLGARRADERGRVGHAEDFIRGFQVFDKEGNGTIGQGELKYVLTSLGEKLSDDEVDELLKGVKIERCVCPCTLLLSPCLAFGLGLYRCWRAAKGNPVRRGGMRVLKRARADACFLPSPALRSSTLQLTATATSTTSPSSSRSSASDAPLAHLLSSFPPPAKPSIRERELSVC